MSGHAENCLLQGIYGRRSIRKFEEGGVSREQVREILKAGLAAPTGKGMNPVRFLVLEADDPRREFFVAGCHHSKPYVRSAPYFIALYLDLDHIYHVMKNHQGVGACIENMLLAARALGLGTVWIGEITGTARDITVHLGLDPDKYELQAGICLGVPAQKPTPKKDAPLETFLLEEF